MTHVLVLTSAGPLGAGEIKLAQVALAAAATKAQATRRLADKAAEISFVGDVDAVLPAVRTALGSAPIDANVVPAENRQKRLLIVGHMGINVEKVIVVKQVSSEVSST